MQITITSVDHAKPIHAIKEIRSLTGRGLKETKDLHDRIRDTGNPETVEIAGDATGNLDHVTAFAFYKVEPDAQDQAIVLLKHAINRDIEIADVRHLAIRLGLYATAKLLA